MVFSSTTFLFLFLPIVLVLYYNPLFKGRQFRNIVLLISSLVFYAWGEPLFIVVMLLSIFITWAAGLKLEQNRNKKLLVIIVTYHVILLFVFKYLTFIASEVGRWSGMDREIVSIKLPIGISFFTFQLMSYIFDIYYGKAKAQKNVLYMALYISLFPQLIAGPIVRYNQIAEQIEVRNERKESIVLGTQKFIYGLSKKVLVADYMAMVADYSFGNIGAQSTLMAWLGAVSYTLQIYFDFSGYSDMAIGLGKMFGFDFVENFNYPYISKNITDFWRRWHISLSSWFRDYVYIPLGGNRCNRNRWIFNMFVVWALTGVWHGANWTFLLWGLIYFVFLLLEKTTNYMNYIGPFSYIVTGVIVILNWVIFRANSVPEAFHYFKDMLSLKNEYGLIGKDFVTYGHSAMIILIIAIVGMTPLVNRLFKKLVNTKAECIESIWIIVIAILSLMHSISSTYSPFIYFYF